MPTSPIVVRVPAPRAPKELPAHAAQKSSAQPQLRRYVTNALTRDGSIVESRHVAPALPVFEDAFCAFSRGSLVETVSGPMAIEDLLPGDKIVTADGFEQPIIWIGRTTVVPGQPLANRRRLPLTRIMTDSFGVARPNACLITGPAARLLNTPPHLRGVGADAKMLTPTAEFIDGVNVVETAPPTPVELFHICLPRHAAIRVGGLEFESYHPGPNAARSIGHAMRDVFLKLFPHANYLTSFGPIAYPRAGDGPIYAVGA